MPLPGHAESYNPPPEYLLNEEEKKKFDEMDPSERFLNLFYKYRKTQFKKINNNNNNNNNNF